jgi:DNA-binding MarR family transcriptional regulator
LIFQLVREQRSLLEQRLAPLDLTTQQAGVLLQVARQREARPNQIAIDVGTDTAGMTRLLDRLEAKGLLARRDDPGDRRSLIIELTRAGEELARKAGPIFGSLERDLSAGHSAVEVERIQSMLRRLLNNLQSARP